MYGQHRLDACESKLRVEAVNGLAVPHPRGGPGHHSLFIAFPDRPRVSSSATDRITGMVALGAVPERLHWRTRRAGSQLVVFAVPVGLITTRVLVSRGFACRPEEAGKDTRKGVLQDREAGADYAQVGLNQGPDAAWDKIVGDVLLVLD